MASRVDCDRGGIATNSPAAKHLLKASLLERTECMVPPFTKPPEFTLTVGENQNHMRHDEEDVDPHQPEMPDTRCVVPSKERGQPMELHGLVNCPACSDRKQSGEWNREVCCALEGVVLCVKAGMQPLAARHVSEEKTEVVSEHSECVKKIGPAG